MFPGGPGWAAKLLFIASLLSFVPIIFPKIFPIIYSRNFSCDFFRYFFRVSSIFVICLVLFPWCYFPLIYSFSTVSFIYIPLLWLWACRD